MSETTVAVPPQLEARLGAPIETAAQRLGVPVKVARRSIEIAILSRGVAAMERDG